ncbi:hypothetical protein JCM5353_002832 [Sporobolomyces roseus]
MDGGISHFRVVSRSSSSSNRLPKRNLLSSAPSDDDTSEGGSRPRPTSHESSHYNPVKRQGSFIMLEVSKRRTRLRSAAYYPQLISSKSTAPRYLSYQGLDAYRLLTVDLPVCRIGTIKIAVTGNSVAETSGINKRRIKIQPRLSTHPVVEQTRYFNALKTVRGTLLPMKRELRSLYKEGDSSDAFLTNVINPVCAVLSGFIAPHLRGLLRIEVQSQATYGYGKEDKENYVGNSYLDHALVLVDRKVADTVEPTFHYLKTVAFNVNWSEVRGKRATAPLSVTYEVCSNVARSKKLTTNPAQRGIRNAVCYEAVQSLRDLGVADWKLLGIAADDPLHHHEIDDEIKVALGV